MSVSKENPFLATLVERKTLNKPGSKKCTVHLSLDISGSNLHYNTHTSFSIISFNKNEPHRQSKSNNEMNKIMFLYLEHFQIIHH